MASSESAKNAARAYYHRNREECLARQREWRENNPGYGTQYDRDNRQKRQSQKRQRMASIREYIANRKLALGCSQCGYNAHHAALDWHHPDNNKENHVSFCQSIEAAEREMAKCIVLCSNCHRIHHWQNKPMTIEETVAAVLKAKAEREATQ